MVAESTQVRCTEQGFDVLDLGAINDLDVSGLGLSRPYLACGDLPKSYNNVSVTRLYERLGSF